MNRAEFRARAGVGDLVVIDVRRGERTEHYRGAVVHYTNDGSVKLDVNGNVRLYPLTDIKNVRRIRIPVDPHGPIPMLE